MLAAPQPSSIGPTKGVNVIRAYCQAACARSGCGRTYGKRPECVASRNAIVPCCASRSSPLTTISLTSLTRLSNACKAITTPCPCLSTHLSTRRLPLRPPYPFCRHALACGTVYSCLTRALPLAQRRQRSSLLLSFHRFTLSQMTWRHTPECPTSLLPTCPLHPAFSALSSMVNPISGSLDVKATVNGELM